MFEFIIVVLLSAFVAVQLTKVVTNLLPSSLNTAGKTLVAAGIEIVVGLLVGLLVGLFSGFNVVRVIGTIVGTIVIAQFAYDNIFKPLSVLFDYLKEKCKIFISRNK